MKNEWKALSLLVGSLVIFGCGKAEEVAPVDPIPVPIPQTLPASGYSTIQPFCYNSYDLRICKFNVSSMFFNGVRALDPAHPTDAMTDTGVDLRAGDRLVFSGSGGWGEATTKTKTYFGFLPVTTTSVNCSAVNLSGVDSKGKTKLNNGFPAGLYYTDGAESFLLGSNKTTTVSRDGRLHVGLNAPINGDVCVNLNVSRFEILRCENSSGAIVTCPSGV